MVALYVLYRDWLVTHPVLLDWRVWAAPACMVALFLVAVIHDLRKEDERARRSRSGGRTG